MKIYTKTGDTGETGLFGGGRVPKDNSRVEAYGTVDELNAVLGVALTEVDEEDVRGLLIEVQRQLFDVGADLATPLEHDVSGTKRPVPRVKPEQTTALEQAIDRFETALPPLTQFILPGGSAAGARLHVARCLCRRAERRVVSLSREQSINPEVLPYLNRLSDLLFILARVVNHRRHVPEMTWK